MPDYKGSITLYEHDSDCCTYLGMSFKDDGPYEGEYDLYICLQEGYRPPTILARYGNEGGDYYSGLCFAAEERNPILWEGAKRAIALKLLTQEELDRETGKRISGSIRFESAGTMKNGRLTGYIGFEYCSECEEEMLWDADERIYYCPNTWEHG